RHEREMAGIAQGGRAASDAGGCASGSHHRRGNRSNGRHPIRGALARRAGEPRRRARRQRDRARHRGIRSWGKWRADRAWGPFGHHTARLDHHTRGPAWITRGLPGPALRCGRRSRLLRARFDQSVSARRGLRRSHPQWGEARRSAGAESDPVRARDETDDCEGARPHRAADAARPRRRGDRMKRRAFIALLGGGGMAARGTRAADGDAGDRLAHRPLAHIVCRLPERFPARARGHGLRRGPQIEYRFGEGRYDRMPEMAADLVRRPVAAMLVTGGGAQPVLTFRVITTIPVVFVTGADPVRGGIVQSLNRPGGNVTGVYQFAAAMDAKRLGMLREIVPSARDIGVLVNPTYAEVETQLKEVGQAASTLGLAPQVLRASTEGEIDAAFAAIAAMRAGALLVCADPFFNSRRNQIVALAVRHAIPAIYEQREFAEAGGLVSYGASIRQAYAQAGTYTGRILKGEKPADLPVAQTTK